MEGMKVVATKLMKEALPTTQLALLPVPLPLKTIVMEMA
jgi:hypothetical protein